MNIVAKYNFTDSQLAKKMVTVQGVYTTLTGAWPLIHMNSFLQVTGPKTDLWLVKTLSLLFVCMGLSFISAVNKREQLPLGIVLLSVCSSISLSSVDIYYCLNGVIAWTYLLDAFIQVIFITIWLAVISRGYFYKEEI